MLTFEKIHEDERGEIYLVLGILPEGRELTLFTTKKGYARGGCIHRKNCEDCVVIQGEIEYFVEGMEPIVLSQGESYHICVNTPHYFVALTDETVVMEWGPTPEEKKEKHLEYRKIVEKINQETLAPIKYAKKWSKGFGTEEDWARSKAQENHPDRLLLKEIVEQPVIDVGCGTGLDASIYGDYVGIDVTPEFIASAHRNYGVDRLVLCDARHLPFRDKTFKTAFSKGVIIHYPQNEGTKMIHEMLRISDTTYIAWGIPLIGPGHGENHMPTCTPKHVMSKSGFHVDRYDLTELEKHFEIYPMKKGTSVTLVKEG